MVLAYNKIVSLQGLQELAGGDYALVALDLRDNQVAMGELSHLAGLKSLEELCFQHGAMANPLCRQPGYTNAVVRSVPGLVSLDGRKVADGLGERCGEEPDGNNPWSAAPPPPSDGGHWEPRLLHRRGSKAAREAHDPRLGSLEIGSTLRGDEALRESEVMDVVCNYIVFPYVIAR
jgi:hypothetical protein